MRHLLLIPILLLAIAPLLAQESESTSLLRAADSASAAVQSAVYDATLAKRYQGLLDEGHRYEHLSWGAFGVAGGFAVAATVLFLHDRHESRIEPVVTTHSAGVSVRF